MATLTILFTFLADTQSFVATPGLSVTSMIWDSAIGNPLGSLTQTRTLKAASVGTNTWVRTLTYEQMGVPPGATITGITSGSMQSKFTTYTSGDTTTGSTSGAVTLADGTNTVTLSAQRLFKGNPSGTSSPDTVFTTTNGTDATVGGGTFTSVASTTSCTLTINNGLRNTNVTGSSVVLKQDQLSFVVNYTPGAWNYKAGGSGTFLNQGLLGHWPLNEGAGTTVHDYSGYNNHGTLQGSPLPTWVNDPRFGRVIKFAGGTAGDVTLGNIWDSYFANQSFSVCFWHKPTATGYTQFSGIVQKLTGSSPFNGWEAYLNQTSGYGAFKVIDGGQNIAQPSWDQVNNPSPAVPTTTITLDTWHFVTLVADRGNQTAGISVDGFPFLTGSTSSVGSITTSGSILLGSDQSGQMHDLRIYSRPLTIGEANAIMRGNTKSWQTL